VVGSTTLAGIGWLVSDGEEDERWLLVEEAAPPARRALVAAAAAAPPPEAVVGEVWVGSCGSSAAAVWGELELELPGRRSRRHTLPNSSSLAKDAKRLCRIVASS
jgi:hypothetical protein